MKKSLMTEWGIYTPDGGKLSREVINKLRPIIKRAIKKYKTPEVKAVIEGAIHIEIAMANALACSGSKYVMRTARRARMMKRIVKAEKKTGRNIAC